MDMRQLRRLLGRKCPNRMFYQGQNVGLTEFEYYLHRNHLPEGRRDQVIYHLFCTNAGSPDSPIIKNWYISEDSLKENGEELLFQIAQEVERYSNVPNRIYI